MGKATKVKDLPGFRGKAALYFLDPPVDDDMEYVVVSATVVPFGEGPETYIFPADSSGEITDWGELHGSYKGDLDHAKALRGAGYEVA
jgi:hypothetical protein